jgi:hypothetical protein
VSDYDVTAVGAGAPGEHCTNALAEGGLRMVSDYSDAGAAPRLRLAATGRQHQPMKGSSHAR